MVLNSLAGELTDASLRLLARGGAFIEMGKTDIRDPAQVAAGHPGVAYRAFDLAEAGPERLGQILNEVTGLLAGGELPLPPVRAWDVRRAPEAFRFMSQARHAGKLVLTIPPDPAAPREPGTVLVTGGTGTLGGLVAGHLAATGRARALLLASRSGPAAPGAAALAAGLAAAGAAGAGDRLRHRRPGRAGRAAGRDPRVRPADHRRAHRRDRRRRRDRDPDPGPGQRRDAAQGRRRLAPAPAHPATPTWTTSSCSPRSPCSPAGPGRAATWPGNTFLDALAAYRRAAGLPAVSLAWGLWAHRAGIGRNLSEGRLATDRPQRAGGTDRGREGLALLDLALDRDEAVLVPARLDVAGWRARAGTRRGGARAVAWPGQAVGPPEPVRPRSRTQARRERCDGQLAGLSAAERDRVLVDLVRAHAAAVLGHASPEADRAWPGIQRHRVRFADRGGTAEPAAHRDRASAARHADLRLPHPGACWPPGCGPNWPGARTRPPGPARGGGGGRADRRGGHGLPVPRRGGEPGGPVGPAGRGRRRDLGLPGGPGLGHRGAVRPRPRARRYLL